LGLAAHHIRELVYVGLQLRITPYNCYLNDAVPQPTTSMVATQSLLHRLRRQEYVRSFDFP